MMWQRYYRRPTFVGRRFWRDLQGLQNGREYWLGGTLGPIQSSFPLVNAWENEEGLVISAELPGVELENLDIAIEDESITLSGTRIAPKFSEDTRAHRRERNHGEFSRTLRLPYRVNVDEVDAQLKNGILRLELPRLPEEKPRKIEIKSS